MSYSNGILGFDGESTSAKGLKGDPGIPGIGFKLKGHPTDRFGKLSVRKAFNLL